MADREKKFSFLLTDKEKAQLEALADAESRSSANWLRLRIAAEYAARFGAKPPRRPKREKKLLGT
jgi:hypothetical protein